MAGTAINVVGCYLCARRNRLCVVVGKYGV